MDYARAVEEAAALARRAGDLLREALGGRREIERKSSLNDIVTEMDRRVEAFLARELRLRFPACEVRGEELGTSGSSSEHVWHVDPIDGTNNYLHRFPWFAVSIGLARRGVPVAGVVYNVMPDEMFSAWEGGGAWLDGERISVSSTEGLGDSLLATGFPYWIHEAPPHLMENVISFVKVARGLRRVGAASLDLACVACGRYDGYWEESLQTWDVCAGIVLVREAGGVVTDYDGAPAPLPTEHVVASNGRIHGAMVERVRGRYRGAQADTGAGPS